MGEHQGNTNLLEQQILNGVAFQISVYLVWKEVINDQKKIVRQRRKAAEEMADEIFAEQLAEKKQYLQVRKARKSKRP